MPFILKEEGGYVNDPDDPGGETNMGISRRQYPNEDIKGMTTIRATELYRHDYWLKYGCDKLHWPMNLYVFDAAVNMHPTIVKKLRRDSHDWFEFLLARLRAYAMIAVKRRSMQKWLPIWVLRVYRGYQYGRKVLQHREERSKNG